jgi:hypothetical protein
MSAYVVSKAEIDALVNGALRGASDSPGYWLPAGSKFSYWWHDAPGETSRYGTPGGHREVTHENASDIGQMLVLECVRSVGYRYPDSDAGAGDLPGPCDAYYLEPYVYPARVGELPRLSTGALASLIGCFEYQSCEHPEWRESEAFAFCATLKDRLLRALPGDYREVDGICREEVAETPPEPETKPERLDRDETITRIRAALKKRSGKAWSVTGGRGTGWGWINIQAPPRRRTGAFVKVGEDETGAPIHELRDVGEAREFGYMTPADCAELAELLGLSKPVHFQGESIPSGGDYYAEYLDRAEGRSPSVHGVQYWD